MIAGTSRGLRKTSLTATKYQVKSICVSLLGLHSGVAEAFVVLEYNAM
jgi:hypothetical protein